MTLPGRARIAATARRVAPRAVLRAAARLRRRHASLGVVVVVTDSNAVFLDDLMGMLGHQTRRADEVLLVPVGPHASASEPLSRAGAASWRVRVLAPGANRGDAVLRGVGAATTERLMVLDAGDQLETAGFAALGACMDDDGADLAGASRRDLAAVQLADVMFLRSLWHRSSRSIPDGPYGEWWAATRLVLDADRPVSVPPAARSAERRGGGHAFGTMPVLAPSAGTWSGLVRDLLTELSDDPAREPVLRRLLDGELPRYLEDAERCTPEQWAALRDLSAHLLDLAPEGLLAQTRVESRVRLRLTADGHREALERFNAERWLEADQFPTRVEAGRVVALLPVDPSLVPSDALLVSESETPLVTQLRRMWWDEDAVAVELLVAVAKVPSRAIPRLVGAAWVAETGQRVPVELEPAPDPDANAVVRDRFADHTDGVFRGRVDPSALLGEAGSGGRWRLEATLDLAGVSRHGSVDQVDSRGSAGAFPPRRVSGLTVRSRALPGGGVELVAAPDPEPSDPETPGWGVTDVQVDGDELLVRGSLPSLDASAATFQVRGPHTTTAVNSVVTDAAFEARVPLRHDPWQLGSRPLPPGTYRVFARPIGAAEVPLVTAAELAPRTPLALRSDTWRVRVRRGRDGSLLLVLAAPLADDETGPSAQQELQSRYAVDDRPTDPRVVYLQSYTGQVATDSPLAIHHALRRLRPDLDLRWGVADRSTVVPAGGSPVLIRSREWYDLLAGAGWVVTNIDMERWFVKRPDQRLLQSFHGYPSKLMGISAWEAKNFTRRRIERQLRRTSGTWDLLLTPNPAMSEHYRREYEYDGKILAEGYPRDDALLAPDADEVRSRTRSRLGIPDGARVVLYAPTWRDDLATNFRAAAAVDQLDVERAARELGEGYVFLLRGHRFHRPRSGSTLGARLRDVTEYPEVNDLILSSDAAVLDYSSLRFDFALTGRPIVFLVPDLDRYEGRVRGFLFDFRSSAPGPLVASTDEVVSALRDLDQIRDKHHEEIAEFNARFNDRQDGAAAERAVRAFFGTVPV